MHTMGKVGVWLVVVAALAASALTSKLIQVRDGWTSVNDMFEEVKSVPSVEPKDARCDLPL